MGSLKSSSNVFESHQTTDPFTWGVLIKGFASNGFEKEAILFYKRMLCDGVKLSGFVFPSILRVCARFGDLGVGEIVHGSGIKGGFEADDVVGTALLSMYGELDCLGDARKVFDEMSARDIVAWSSMVSCLVKNGEAVEGLDLFREMVYEGLEVDSVMMLSVAEACGELGFVELARSIHGYIVRNEIERHDGMLASSLILMYGKCGDLCGAEMLFENAAKSLVSSWTAMISCYKQHGWHKEALEVFARMQKSKVEPNAMTFAGIISSCARLGLRVEGKSCHSYTIRNGLDPEYELLGPMLIELYSECGSAKECKKMVEIVREKNVIMWNMLISVHIREGLLIDASLLLVQMHAMGFFPDSYSISSVLSACATIGLSEFGCQVHSYTVKTGVSDEFVLSSLIDMYSKCGILDSAKMIFSQFHGKSVVIWSSMISGYCHNGNYVEAIGLFDILYSNSLEMNEVTIISIIQACSNLGCLEKGKWVHQNLIGRGLSKDIYIETALTDMYAKLGNIKTARKIFDSMKEKNVVSWSAMIDGYGAHGDTKTAISLFNEMTESGIKPNEIAFLNILSACRHAGYVEEGKLYYNVMTRDYGIIPKPEHIVCIVDLLSRAGDLDESYKVIKSMLSLPDASIFGSFLNGCKIHQRIDLIKQIEDDISNIDLQHLLDAGSYSLLSNIHAEMGNWVEFGQTRSAMTDLGLKKVRGYSTIEND
ncbi:hypothetical protein Drorol1_Dr00018819 [Drosera rotundifolia]